MGTITADQDTTEWFASRFIWSDARYAGDLFRLTPGIFLRELGTAGQPSEITSHGVGWRGLAVLLDGRPLNDPVTGTFNLYDFPLEFLDRIELWEGPEAFFAAQGGTGLTMNMVARQYNTGRPITKIRFVQGPYEHLLTDALFTQNIVRNLNLTFGVQRQVTDGRFVNTGFDSWNVRTRLRYNVSDRLNLALTDLYRRDVLGMNNGVNIDSTNSLGLDPYNEAEAVVFSEDNNDTRSGRDVNLSSIAALFPDTSWSTKATLYYSTHDRTYRDTSGVTSGLFDRFVWRTTGGIARQTIRLPGLTLIAGGQFETQHVDLPDFPKSISKTSAAWFGTAEMNVLDIVRPRITLRGESVDHAKAFSYGVSVEVTPMPALAVSAGYGSFYRFPTIQERNWTLYQFDPASGLNLLEHHNLGQLSMILRLSSSMKISATASQRTIDNALIFKPSTPGSPFASPTLQIVPTQRLRQFAGSLWFSVWDFEFDGGVTMTETKEQGTFTLRQPKIVLSGSLAYQSKLFNGALGAKIGVQARYASKHTGERFLASYGIYEDNDGPAIPEFSTLNLYGIFNIGDAFITVTWENVLDAKYYTVYPYPELGRNIKVGVNWIFLD